MERVARSHSAIANSSPGRSAFRAASSCGRPFMLLSDALSENTRKKPNGLCRISVVHTEPGDVVPEFEDTLVDLLASVFKQLSSVQQCAFRRKTTWR